MDLFYKQKVRVWPRAVSGRLLDLHYSQLLTVWLYGMQIVCCLISPSDSHPVPELVTWLGQDMPTTCLRLGSQKCLQDHGGTSGFSTCPWWPRVGHPPPHPPPSTFSAASVCTPRGICNPLHLSTARCSRAGVTSGCARTLALAPGRHSESDSAHRLL